MFAGSPFVVGGSPVDVAVGDFNADGNTDLAVGDDAHPELKVRLNNGAGDFSNPAPGSPYGTASNPLSVAVGDFNSDGNEDAVTANSGGGGLTVRLGGAGGSLSTEAPGSPISIVSDAQDVTVGDFNSDGVQDLLVTEYGKNRRWCCLARAMAPS